MALCFNTPLPDLEDELMQLILDGHIKARIDSINKVSFRSIYLIFKLKEINLYLFNIIIPFFYFKFDFLCF